MSIDAGADTNSEAQDTQARSSLATAAARNLATTTKTVPQMQDITSRWLLKMLPWVQVSGGTYRVNRRLSYRVGDGRVQFVQTGSEVRVIPAELSELAPLRGFEDEEVLRALADRFVRREFAAGETLATIGEPNDRVFLVVHGKIGKFGVGPYGDRTSLGLHGDGDHFGEKMLVDRESTWDYTATAATSVIVLEMPRDAFDGVHADTLRDHLADYVEGSGRPQNAKGEAEIPMSAGHHGEAVLPGSFVDYELKPREYELSAAQTVLRVHSRVADLYNQPMDQIEQQLRLTIEALRERQEHELINNREFGLLHNADYEQRIQAQAGPPTPDDMDELLSRRRGSRLFLAHPRTIAAFGRECSRLGLYPTTVDVGGNQIPAWRGVPIFPCNKIPISEARTSSILVLRTGEDDQGVVGLHQTGLPDEYQPGLSVRFMGINEQALISYLVTAYYSAAILVPDALGVLENVEISRVG
ncbi:family 2B encapsulin nanocompartment shell protein [Embleya sp. NBC_00888]|uniref:family 2B encapsulin nanocompartment shell protein n=1 Tax=Embleya sp. NBC_00888 TaxID=2975960 RepID=UPI00386EC993|nr:family 2B encapsulin nanocompartment shell protein [Embleya sp. NBC_00888]